MNIHDVSPVANVDWVLGLQ